MKRRTQPNQSRLVFGAVALGALVAAALLARQVSDYLSDARQPVLRQSDLIGALGSVAMLAFFGVMAYNAARKVNR